MIEIKNLTKRYGENTVYENFSVNFEEGEVTCILGESGSGKTTLLNCVAYLSDFVGEIPKLDCSYVFQTPRLVPNLTVYGNLNLVCRDGDKIRNMLEKVRLLDKANAYPVSLSGGEKQRVSLARAFLYKSRILLMDEPFSSLDLKLKIEMFSLFSEILKEDKRTVLFVTHDVDEAAVLADRIIVLKKGRIISDFKPESKAPREIGGDEALRKKLIFALLQ